MIKESTLISLKSLFKILDNWQSLGEGQRARLEGYTAREADRAPQDSMRPLQRNLSDSVLMTRGTPFSSESMAPSSI